MTPMPTVEAALSAHPVQFSAVRPAYQPPRVQDLGAWQVVTLLGSVPFNPGSVYGPGDMPHPNGGENHGTF